MKGQRVVITALTGTVVVLAAELVQARAIAQRLQAEGVTIDLPLVGRTQLQPPKSSSGASSGNTITFPPDVEKMRARMHVVAGVVALVAMGLTFAVTKD